MVNPLLRRSFTDAPYWLPGLVGLVLMAAAAAVWADNGAVASVQAPGLLITSGT